MVFNVSEVVAMIHSQYPDLPSQDLTFYPDVWLRAKNKNEFKQQCESSPPLLILAKFIQQFSLSILTLSHRKEKVTTLEMFLFRIFNVHLLL